MNFKSDYKNKCYWYKDHFPSAYFLFLLQCSRSCGTGVRIRDVQCVDTRDKRILRPFHCQSTVFKPRVQMVCHEQKCMEWYVSSWREVSTGAKDSWRLSFFYIFFTDYFLFQRIHLETSANHLWSRIVLCLFIL